MSFSPSFLVHANSSCLKKYEDHASSLKDEFELFQEIESHFSGMKIYEIAASLIKENGTKDLPRLNQFYRSYRTALPMISESQLELKIPSYSLEEAILRLIILFRDNDLCNTGSLPPSSIDDILNAYFLFNPKNKPNLLVERLREEARDLQLISKSLWRISFDTGFEFSTISPGLNDIALKNIVSDFTPLTDNTGYYYFYSKRGYAAYLEKGFISEDDELIKAVKALHLNIYEPIEIQALADYFGVDYSYLGAFLSDLSRRDSTLMSRELSDDTRLLEAFFERADQVGLSKTLKKLPAYEMAPIVFANIQFKKNYHVTAGWPLRFFKNQFFSEMIQDNKRLKKNQLALFEFEEKLISHFSPRTVKTLIDSNNERHYSYAHYALTFLHDYLNLDDSKRVKMMREIGISAFELEKDGRKILSENQYDSILRSHSRLNPVIESLIQNLYQELIEGKTAEQEDLSQAEFELNSVSDVSTQPVSEVSQTESVSLINEESSFTVEQKKRKKSKLLKWFLKRKEK